MRRKYRGVPLRARLYSQRHSGFSEHLLFARSREAQAPWALMPPTALRYRLCAVGGMLVVALAASKRASRDACARLLSCVAVLNAPASCCSERDSHDEEGSRWTERVRFADLAFWRRVGSFRDLLTWRLFAQEIVLEERDLVLAPGLYFCKRSSGPPSSRGGVRIRRMVG